MKRPRPISLLLSALLDKNPDCASDDQVAEFLIFYAYRLNISAGPKVAIDALQRFLPRIDRLTDNSRVVIIGRHYIFALLWNTRYRQALVTQEETSRITGSRAYALAGGILVSTVVAPKPLQEFEKLTMEAVKATSDSSDAYIQNWTRFVIAWEEFHRGRMLNARNSAREHGPMTGRRA